jgi:WD40 repeat protein
MPPTFLQSYGSTVVGLLQETSAGLVVWNWSGSPDPRVHALGTGSVDDFVVLAPAPLGPSAWLSWMAISGDGRTLAAGDSEGAVHLWDARTGALLDGIDLPGTGYQVTGVAFDRDGKTLAAATASGIRLLV